MAELQSPTKILVDANAVAPMLGVSYQRVVNLAREGILPSVRLGRQLRFNPAQIEAFIASGGKAFEGGWRKESQ